MLTLIEQKIETAADVLALLERLKVGFDLSAIAVTNGDGDPVGSMELQNIKLLGKSGYEHRISFWLKPS